VYQGNENPNHQGKYRANYPHNPKYAVTHNGTLPHPENAPQDPTVQGVTGASHPARANVAVTGPVHWQIAVPVEAPAGFSGQAGDSPPDTPHPLFQTPQAACYRAPTLPFAWSTPRQVRPGRPCRFPHR
jgi:hypothetical protein